MKLKSSSIIFFCFVFPVLNALGQGYSKPTRMTGPGSPASISQDVILLKEQLGEMRFEVERLLRENEALELRVKKLEVQSASSVSDVVFKQELASLRAEFNRLNKSQREELLAQISGQIRALAKETEKSLASVSSGASSGGTPPVTNFDDTVYPKTGIFYVVKSGDSLSKIATSAGSRISYIIHANKIPNPDKLQVGEELFIPIDNP